MDVTSLSQGMQAPSATAPAPVALANQAAANREIIQAVKAVNSTEMFGHDNVLVFQKDRQTNKMVIRVVNKDTQEVISQIPAEYLLRLAQDGKQDYGSL